MCIMGHQVKERTYIEEDYASLNSGTLYGGRTAAASFDPLSPCI